MADNRTPLERAALSLVESLEALDGGVDAVNVLREGGPAGGLRRFDRIVDRTNLLRAALTEVMAAAEADLEPSADLEGPPGATDEEATRKDIELGDFLSFVASGMSKAQQNLDEGSEEYLARIAGRPHLAPTVFRIPKLSATFNLGISSVTSSGILFWKEKHTESVEQTVAFELVEAPPAVDVTRDVGAFAIGVRGILLGPEADRVTALVKNARTETEDSRAALVTLLESDRAHALVLRAAGEGGYFFLGRVEGAALRLGIWRLLGEDESAELLSVRLDPAGNNTTAKAILDLLADAFARQEAALKRAADLAAILAGLDQ